MTATGILVVSNVKEILQSLQYVGKYVRTLFIHLNISGIASKPKPAPAWGKIINQIYMDIGGINSKNIGNAPMDISVLIAPLKGKGSISGLRPIEMLFSDSNCPEICEPLRSELNIHNETIYLQFSSERPEVQPDNNDEPEELKMYDTVVLGGTFDRIHLGHKIFLTQAVLRACKRLVVGVTAPEMTHSKILWELILPVEQRIANVKKFLQEVDSSLQYDVVKIEDPFGPTSTDPEMDMIVVSEETLRGGQKINEIRTTKNLRQLDIFCVKMVENKCINGPKELKISSSNARIDLLGTRLRNPESRPNLPINPYIIGLTGGIASGKSQMAERFRKMGAIILNCDLIAHEIYEPGQVCYEKIVEHFGKGILDIKGFKIDRKKLAAIVFEKAPELTKLDEIVWPELLMEVKRRIHALTESASEENRILNIVVIEAAVLIQAGWENECHEIWSMIVPSEIAVQRVMNRNMLSEEEARKRMKSQLSNTEIVAKSNVIFSSQWDAEFTQKQAERAWKNLHYHLYNSLKNGKNSTNSML